MSTIGVIGLGRTGMPFAKNLIERGHTVIGLRRTDPGELVKAGGRAAKTPREVASAADVIFTCLPGSDSLATVMEGPDGLIASATPRHVICELGSFPLAVKEQWRDRLAERGATFLDGEISGTPAMTAARQSVILIAGPKEKCEAVIALAKDGSDHARYSGEFGAATKLKLVANVLVAVHTAAAAEAMLLVEKSGLDVALALEVIGLGAGSSTMWKARAPSMAARKFVDPAPGPVSMLAAYIDPIRALAASSNSPTPLFSIASQLLERATADGRAHHDIGCVIEMLEERNNR